MNEIRGAHEERFGKQNACLCLECKFRQTIRSVLTGRRRLRRNAGAERCWGGDAFKIQKRVWNGTPGELRLETQSNPLPDWGEPSSYWSPEATLSSRCRSQECCDLAGFGRDLHPDPSAPKQWLGEARGGAARSFRAHAALPQRTRRETNWHLLQRRFSEALTGPVRTPAFQMSVNRREGAGRHRDGARASFWLTLTVFPHAQLSPQPFSVWSSPTNQLCCLRVAM